MSLTPPTRAERHAKGKSLRKLTPRGAHARLLGPSERDATALLAGQNATRLPSLVPVRMQLMAENPFAFLRGAALVMAHDLQWQPVAGVKTQACGDCHVMNFGAFATPEDNIIFDINDFDETLPGVDFTVDLKRLTTSVAVAAAQQGFSRDKRRDLAALAARAYRKKMDSLSFLSPLEIFRARVDLQKETKKFRDAGLRRKIAELISRARGEGLDRDENFPTPAESGAPIIADKAPRLFHFARESDAGRGFDPIEDLTLYRARLAPSIHRLLDHYRLSDVVFKAVGVGSVGTYCYAALYMSGDLEPLLLQIKEASPSVLEILNETPAFSGPQGQRVVEGQRQLQAASDVFLGWCEDAASGRHYYVRHLKNRRLAEVGDIAEGDALADYAKLCGKTLAHSHARSGDPALISGYIGEGDAFDDAIARFALAYEERNAADFEHFRRANAAKS